MSRTVVLFAYPDCQLLDVAGPWQVFATANALGGGTLYRPHLLAERSGTVVTNGSMRIDADLGWEGLGALGPIDTFLVAGGSGVFAQRGDVELLGKLRGQADGARRFGAVCTGAFLPATGLLTNAYLPAEKARAQAANEFLLFSVVALTALGAGPMLSALGWAQLNAWLIPFALVPLSWCRSGTRLHARG